MGVYPRICIGSTFRADGGNFMVYNDLPELELNKYTGIVIASSDFYGAPLAGVLSPFRGWISDPDGPKFEYVQHVTRRSDLN